MGPRFAIAAGLLAGVGVAAILLLGLLALAPEPASPPTPAPSITQPSSSGTPSPIPPATPASMDPAPASAGAPSGAGFHVGEPAPALVAPQVRGGTIDLASLKGKPVWVNFMATGCPPCTVAGFAQRFNATFPLGLDGDETAAARWGAVALPVHFWIDAKGIVRDGAASGIGADTMVHGLESILPGVDVTP
ncbi:MAG: redoxin domain-containing protein [Chloroflexi bacterium]|nr:redoxin domain-containing protein [Chloroflexota bacterium]